MTFGDMTGSQSPHKRQKLTEQDEEYVPPSIKEPSKNSAP